MDKILCWLLYGGQVVAGFIADTFFYFYSIFDELEDMAYCKIKDIIKKDDLKE